MTTTTRLRTAALIEVWPRPAMIPGLLDPAKLPPDDHDLFIELEARLATGGFAALTNREVMTAARIAAAMRRGRS
jgi:hypothetical protein